MRKNPTQYYYNTVKPDGLCWCRIFYIIWNYFKNGRQPNVDLQDVDLSNQAERNEFIFYIEQMCLGFEGFL